MTLRPKDRASRKGPLPISSSSLFFSAPITPPSTRAPAEPAPPHHRPPVLDLLLERAVLRLQPMLAQRIAHHEQRLVEGERLLHEVLRAHAHGLDRGLDVAVPGNEHHRHFGIDLAD